MFCSTVIYGLRVWLELLILGFQRMFQKGDVLRWAAEGLSRRIAKKLILRYLEGGMNLDLESALKEFEETRSEVWKELKEEYRRKGLL